MQRVLCLITLAVLAIPSNARAGCAGVIDAATATVSGNQYDPFNATPVADTHTIRIVSKAARVCDFALVFSAVPGPRQLGGTLSYTLTDLNGRGLLVQEPPSTPPGSSLAGLHIDANASAQLSFLINIGRGQFASPGRYTDNVTLYLFSNENGLFQLQDTRALSLVYTVPQALSVAVGKGEPGGAIQFGELAQGTQKSVSILARSNTPHRFNISSDNRGELLLTPPVTGQNWSVPYVVTVDNYAVDLRIPVGSLTVQAPPTSIAGDNHALTITIGDVSKKRAGLYRDVITVQISAAQP